MKKRIFLYGVPGAGKSTLAEALAKKLGLDYVELDGVRPKAQKHVSKDEDPFLYEYTTEAWKKFGEFNRESVVKGFLAVRKSMSKYIAEELADRTGFVAEAVFVDPATFQNDNSVIFLLTSPGEERHYSQFFVHRPRTSEENGQFKAARYIQDFLITEAQAAAVVQVQNDTNIDAACESVLKGL